LFHRRKLPIMKPRSALDTAGGMAYFPRMLEKIRLHAAGTLEADYHPSLGKGADAFCTEFLRIPYDDLRKRVIEGDTDEALLEWCFRHGRRLDPGDIRIWNAFITKLGWNDSATPRLIKHKAAAGLENREDIQTMAQLFDVEEGRKP